MHALAKHHFYHPNPTASDFAPQNSQSPNFSSTILESFAGSLTFLAFPKADSSPKILESITLESKTLSLRADNGGAAIHKNKAQKVDSSPKILQSHIALGSKDLSLRALAQDKARQSTSTKNAKQAMRSLFRKVDSSNDYSASAEFMDCRAIATALARNDRVGRVDCRADFQSTRNDRKPSPHTLESTFSHDTLFLSSRALRQQGVAIHKSAKDSRIFAHNVQSAFDTKAAGSRIFDEKVGLRRLLRGDKT